MLRDDLQFPQRNLEQSRLTDRIAARDAPKEARPADWVIPLNDSNAVDAVAISFVHQVGDPNLEVFSAIWLYFHILILSPDDMNALPIQTTLRTFRGCLIGGAVGDALGAPVEFMSLSEIRRNYGPSGIREMDTAYGVLGSITDDTQMTLFTAEGLIRAVLARDQGQAFDPLSAVALSYQQWFATQGGRGVRSTADLDSGWLSTIQGLHSRRAPGATCLGALSHPIQAKEWPAKNNSKGCGGVMRVAPVGLVSTDPFELGCKVAGLTHGHPLGYLAAGAMALMIKGLTEGQSIRAAVAAAVARSSDQDELASILQRAVALADSSGNADNCITALGEGWVAEEALAISVFCALRASDFEEGVVLAVNHSGDSDSTGSITGQLLGTLLGVEAIPDRWLAQLELLEVIRTLAEDLAMSFTAREGTLVESEAQTLYARYRIGSPP